MRITRDTLLKLARDTAAQRARRSRGIVCIYLTGSLLEDQPLLGGTTDIDLVLVHSGEPPVEREVVALSEEVTLDLGHISQDRYAHPRRLRTDPWLGSYLCANPLVLHDQGHWFEFKQASGCAQFDLPEYVLERARPLAEEARQEWAALHGAGKAGPAEVMRFLLLMQRAGNALALLSGPPLPERRFFLELPKRAAAVGRPGLASGLADLLGGSGRSAVDWDQWQVEWLAALQAVGQNENCPAKLTAPRIPYYTRAALAMREDAPDAALWILFRTWTEAVLRLGEPSLTAWDGARQVLGLGTEQFAERLKSADAYLDMLEETLEAWAKKNGIPV